MTSERDETHCDKCGIWPLDMAEHMKIEHGDDLPTVEEIVDNFLEIFKPPKIYVRQINYQYDPTDIQVVTLDMEVAFNHVPEESESYYSEIQVWQDGKHIEEWWWGTDSHSYVRRDI